MTDGRWLMALGSVAAFGEDGHDLGRSDSPLGGEDEQVTGQLAIAY